MIELPVTELHADLVDRKLAAVLSAEDSAQAAGLSPFDRLTCRLHRRWLHRCVASSLHVIPFSGHRWCDRCAQPANVAVDELSRTIEVRCSRCGEVPAGLATKQVVRACLASMRAERMSIAQLVLSLVVRQPSDSLRQDEIGMEQVSGETRRTAA